MLKSESKPRQSTKSGLRLQISRSSSTVSPQISAMALMALAAMSCDTLILGKYGRDTNELYGLGWVTRWSMFRFFAVGTEGLLFGLAKFSTRSNSFTLRGRLGNSLGKRRTFLNHFLSERICLKTSSAIGNRNGRGSLLLEISNQTLHVPLSKSDSTLKTQVTEVDTIFGLR